MDSVVVGIIGICFMVSLLLCGMPVAFSLILAGFLGLLYLVGPSVALPQLHLRLYGVLSTPGYAVVPLFILMAYLATVSGLTSEIYKSAEKWLRGVPGGLAMATIAGCAGFAAISGSSVATAALMGKVAFPEMKRYNYDASFAAGTIAAGGTLGFLIPPSIALVIYGILAEVSVGKLLVAGIIPGIILAASFIAIILFSVKMNPKLAPKFPGVAGWREKLLMLKSVWPVLLIFLLMIGGLYAGFFTPNEAGAAGAFGLLLVALAKRKLSLSDFFDALKETMGATCMLFLIFWGAMLFGDFLSISGISTALIEGIGSLSVSPYIVFSLFVLFYIILGCFIEAVAMIIITMPIMLPVLQLLGFDPLWFGIILVLLVQAALITPPIGLNVYVVAGVTRDVPLMGIFRGAAPFLVGIIVVIAVLTAFPQIVLFLPNQMIR